MSKILDIQLWLNLRYNASRRNKHFVTVFGFDVNLGLSTFPYTINQYQPAMEHHNATFQGLTNAKATHAKQVNLIRTLEPQHKIRDNVLLFTWNINIKHTSPKMKPLWIGLLTILSTKYNHYNYSLDLSTDPSLNLMCNNFHISKVKPNLNYKPTMFL